MKARIFSLDENDGKELEVGDECFEVHLPRAAETAAPELDWSNPYFVSYIYKREGTCATDGAAVYMSDELKRKYQKLRA